MNENRLLQQILQQISSADASAMRLTQKRWNSIAKPLHGLGSLETAIVKIAGITGDSEVKLDKKALLVLCADHGVVAEGVTQTGQAVTAIVAENILKGQSCVALMAKKAGVDVFPVDIGMAQDTTLPNDKIAYGTKNMCHEPAMTYKQAVQAILTGWQLVKEKKAEGYQLVALGEMGIGNTTASSAVSAVLLNEAVETMTGRGAGLSDSGLKCKQQAIKKAIALHQPDAEDPIDVLAKVGGFELAGLAGVCLGGAYFKVPIVLDGFISAVSAFVAVRLCPAVKEYLLASHTSKEPGMTRLLHELGLEAPLQCQMCLGEGTGAIAFLPVLELALEVYKKMGTFEENAIEAYKEMGEKECYI